MSRRHAFHRKLGNPLYGQRTNGPNLQALGVARRQDLINRDLLPACMKCFVRVHGGDVRCFHHVQI